VIFSSFFCARIFSAGIAACASHLPTNLNSDTRHGKTTTGAGGLEKKKKTQKGLQ